MIRPMPEPIPAYFAVHGLHCSYFTRKVTGHLDHLRQPWFMDGSVGANEAAREVGWNGGIPVVTTPEGEIVWDSSSIILHLDGQHPDRTVLPDDPVLRFLAFLVEDVGDEWFYRHAVGTRWLVEENAVAGSWDITREGSLEVDFLPVEDVRASVRAAMTGSLAPLGVTEDNVMGWVHDDLVPWQQALAAHVEQHPFLFGDRPSIADLALFGGNVAHFLNDPWCRRLTEETSPAVVPYTHRMVRPGPVELGPWASWDEVPDTLVALLAEAGRHYLPWVAEATVEGSASFTFADGSTAEIAATGFVTWARSVLLARYVALRSPELDAVLERAGILQHFADHVDQAGEVPDPAALPRPADNRPYPAGPR